MIRLQGVSRVYPGRRGLPPVTAVRTIDLVIPTGEFVVITGRSGSGKTTLLNLAAGLAEPTTGRVELGGVDLSALSDRARARLRAHTTGFVFQFPSLLPALTAIENVLFVTLLGRRELVSQANRRAREMLSLVGLSDRADSLPHELSAGEQQRVVIARALFGGPKVLFADEPTSNLDDRSEHDVMELITRLHKEAGLTTMLVTHRRALVSCATQTILMEQGRAVVSVGPSSGDRYATSS